MTPSQIEAMSQSLTESVTDKFSRQSSLDSPRVSSLPGTLDRRTLHLRLEEVASKKLEPPRSLNVREVAKLSKGIFAYQSMSAESIGQCSLDVNSTGTGKGADCLTRALSSQLLDNQIFTIPQWYNSV